VWTATDGSGNAVNCSFDVVVTDNETPIISSCPGTININNDNGACGAQVNWIPPTFTDNCGATMTASHNPGDFFPVGTTQVTYTVTDGTGNTSICTFDVIVTDNELPQMTCNSNIASCDSLVTFTTPNVTDNCGVASVTQITGLPSGSYFPVGTTTVTFEAVDIHGNTNTCSFDVTIHPTPVLNTVDTDVSCNNFGDGSIDLTVTNGTPAYTYTWSNGATTQDISNLDPGVYVVTVEDAFGCSASISDTITQPSILVLNKEVTQVDCYNDSTGAIDLNISGGVLPYTYNWSNGSTAEDLSGISVGSYSVIVTDANGCEVSDNTTITQPDSISIATVVSDATCNAANGAINTLVTGGTSPYDYSWSNGATTANLSNVQGGVYTLTVTDENNCVATVTETVGTTSNISGSVFVTDVLCNGGRTGEALVVIESGNAPFTYEWSTGDTTNPIDGLEAGSYWVNVQDAFGCEMTLTFGVFEPELLTVDLFSPEPLTGFNVSVFGGSDGSIQASVEGGTPAYSYLWSNGSTLENINGLTAGDYSLIVTDENGCTATALIQLVEPDELAMPEGVSPNGDMQNDFFVIKGIESYPNNLLTIYNRWGNVVYEQSGYNNEWQGQNNKGEPLPDGTYYAIFQPSGDSGVEPLTGYIDLRRNR
jgi:gliding motility-associated-like protein